MTESNCDDLDGINCGEVLEKVYLFLDGEVGSEQDDIRIHLDDCSPCLRQYGLEKAVKELVSRSCRDTAPSELRAKVLLKIQQVRIEIEQVEYTSE